MSVLPSIPNTGKNLNTYQVTFKGLNHTFGAADGEIYDMTNITSDHFPVLSPREKRRILADTKNGKGVFFYHGRLYWIAGKAIYRDGEVIGQVGDSDGVRTFVALNNRILIFPDGIYIDDMGVGSLSVSVNCAVEFLAEGFLYGATAERNSIIAPGVKWEDFFSVGDAVEISGCVAYESNNKTAIIREIEGETLRFYQNVFETDHYMLFPVEANYSAGRYCFIDNGKYFYFDLPRAMAGGDQIIWENETLTAIISGHNYEYVVSEGKKGTYLAFAEKYRDTVESSVTIARTVPPFEIVCAVNNRLWGVVGNAIYGSKLGDPFNFNVFDGLSTDSYYLETETDGDFTAAIGYNGYPMFFKENSIHKLYGDYPTNFQLSRQMQQGVKRGCGRTLAIAGDILYYVSRNGVMAYSGGIPTMISEALGKRIDSGVGVSDGRKYYLSAQCSDGTISLYVYDSYHTMWNREDDLLLVSAFYGEYIVAMAEDGRIITLSPGCEVGTEEEDDVEWSVIFADMAMGSPFKKGINKINMRMDPSGGGRAGVEIMFDSNGYWQPVKTIDSPRKHSDILPIVPRRCDHFKIKISGKGVVDIYAMAIQYYQGSENRGGINNG